MIKSIALSTTATAKVKGTRGKALHHESMDTTPQICECGHHDTELPCWNIQNGERLISSSILGAKREAITEYLTESSLQRRLL